MAGNVLVSLLKSVIFRDVMQIVPPDYNRVFHFCWDD